MLEQDKDQPSSPNLPALVPSAFLVLSRTQTTLELLRDVVQESSAEYWYERGKKAEAIENWDEAIFSYGRSTKISGRSGNELWWNSLKNWGNSHKNRAIRRYQDGDREGSLLDEKASEEIEDYIGDVMDGMSQYND